MAELVVIWTFVNGFVILGNIHTERKHQQHQCKSMVTLQNCKNSKISWNNCSDLFLR